MAKLYAKGKKPVVDEFVVTPEVLLDSAKEGESEKLPRGVLMRIRNKGTRINSVNTNRRMYPGSVVLDAIQESNENLVKPGRMVGESPHPQEYMNMEGEWNFKTSLDNTVSRTINQFISDDGWVCFDDDVLDTPKGNILATLVRAKVPVGVSVRSVCKSVSKVINDVQVAVATQMKIKAWDYVMNPGTLGAGTSEILMTDSEMEVVMDGIEFNDPVCPMDGTTLVPVDPDNDNDVDYWACPKCKSRYDVYNGVQVNTSSNQNLYRRWDSPDHGAGKAQTEPPGGAAVPGMDVQKGYEHTNTKGENELTPEEIKAMIAKANEPYKVMMDAQAAQREAEVKRAEAKAFVDGKLEELKSKYSAPVLDAIVKAMGEPKSKEQAEVVLDSVLDMAGSVSANEFLQSLGFTPGHAAAGQSRVSVTNEPKPWQPLVDSMMQSFDRIDQEKGFVPDLALRKHNKELVDKILTKFEQKDIGYQAMKDSAEKVEALMDSGASVSTAQLLNQPSIQTVILLQKFQDLEATQFMMTDVFEGSEWRIPSESFQGAETIDPATQLYDIVVAENSPIPEHVIDVIWASFTPKPRRNAISLTTDTIRAMETGPLKYNAPARAIYHIGKQAARKIDLYAYWDMAVTADEYNPLAVVNESVTVTAVSNGTNVAFKGQLQIGGQAGAAAPAYGSTFKFAAAGSTPIVRPRTKQLITANGTVQSTSTNAITCKVAGGAALTLGGLDTNGNIVGGDFAINFETGDIYFKTGLGIVVGATPVYPVISYSASTNYDLWHTTMGAGYVTNETWLNTLLMQLSTTSALMGSSPRFNPANLGLCSLNVSTLIRNAQMFYKQAQPPGVTLNPTNNNFGSRDEISLNKINAPWVFGDNRILLSQKNSTRYGIQTPYKIEGPITKQDQATGLLLPVKAWYGEEFSAIVTPQVIDANGNVLNPVSRTIRIVS